LLSDVYRKEIFSILVRLWRRYNLTLVVADGVKALDTAISRSVIKVARQT